MLFTLVPLWALALLVRYPKSWLRHIIARGALSFLALALEWFDAPPYIGTALRKETQLG